MPDIDGREVVRILRKNGFKAPIIMLTGHDTDSDTILGLESGAYQSARVERVGVARTREGPRVSCAGVIVDVAQRREGHAR